MRQEDIPQEVITVSLPRGDKRKKRIAIGCQGGVHTSFTAGALKRVLSEQRHEIGALSGFSGGAICAFFD